MAALSDRGIRNAASKRQPPELRISIDPWNDERVKPNSYDITLGRSFKWIDSIRLNHQLNASPISDTPMAIRSGYEQLIVDPFNLPDDLYSDHVVGPASAFTLYPQAFVLGHTVERITLGSQMCARLEGKSSLARLGLMIHSTAGFIDAGWDGQITLELFNFGPLPIALSPAMPIGQLFFETLSSPADKPYGAHDNSKYQGSEGVVGSAYGENQRP